MLLNYRDDDATCVVRLCRTIVFQKMRSGKDLAGNGRFIYMTAYAN
jgi:hypothetical protein